MMTEKNTTWMSLRNEDWKKVNVSTEKEKKLFTNITRRNASELNELIYASVKLIFDKIGVT